MCIGARSGSNPGPLGREPSALTNCASCPLPGIYQIYTRYIIDLYSVYTRYMYTCVHVYDIYLVYTWYILMVFFFQVFCSLHSTVNPAPLPGYPDLPDTAPDPEDERDYEVPDTRSLLDEFHAKMSRSVDNEYMPLFALLKTIPCS